ncbi:hypothetical protein OROGR_023574 [Orobanche gracilis]
MSSRKGPPKHQNKFAWKPHGGQTINPTELGGTLRPYSEVTGVCPRCKDQIDWKRKYGKYKPLTEPAKCQRCSKRNVRQAYHNLCNGCAKEHNVCAKCSCRVEHIVGRDLSEVEAEQRTLDEFISNQECSGTGKKKSAESYEQSKISAFGHNFEKRGEQDGELFAAASLQEYAELSRDNEDNYNDAVEPQIIW